MDVVFVGCAVRLGLPRDKAFSSVGSTAGLAENTSSLAASLWLLMQLNTPAAALSDLADLSDLAGLSDLMPAKLLSKAGKSWLTAQTSSAIHAGLADFFDFLALPPAFGGILIPGPESQSR
ncbi:MAG: hypothetical protein FRX49_09086 [Trebouxia sp. A1-2]|nr:MAG: hypothetical protein FRX49_09086 [Trebouxia sp. A1-2]